MFKVVKKLGWLVSSRLLSLVVQSFYVFRVTQFRVTQFSGEKFLGFVTR